nr:immunoglobulin heavy chain junction region [Mus musculus]
CARVINYRGYFDVW